MLSVSKAKRSILMQKRSKKKSSSFFNQIAFDADNRIIRYEDASKVKSLNEQRTSTDPASISSLQQSINLVVRALKTGNLALLKPFIHPEKNFYVLTHPGAISIPYPCNSIAELKKHVPWLTKGNSRMASIPKFAELPDFKLWETCFQKKVVSMPNEQKLIMESAACILF